MFRFIPSPFLCKLFDRIAGSNFTVTAIVALAAVVSALLLNSINVEDVAKRLGMNDFITTLLVVGIMFYCMTEAYDFVYNLPKNLFEIYYFKARLYDCVFVLPKPVLLFATLRDVECAFENSLKVDLFGTLIRAIKYIHKAKQDSEITCDVCIAGFQAAKEIGFVLARGPHEELRYAAPLFELIARELHSIAAFAAVEEERTHEEELS